MCLWNHLNLKSIQCHWLKSNFRKLPKQFKATELLQSSWIWNHVNHSESHIIWISSPLKPKSNETKTLASQIMDPEVGWISNHWPRKATDFQIGWLLRGWNLKPIDFRGLSFGSLSLETSATAVWGRYMLYVYMFQRWRRRRTWLLWPRRGDCSQGMAVAQRKSDIWEVYCCLHRQWGKFPFAKTMGQHGEKEDRCSSFRLVCRGAEWACSHRGARLRPGKKVTSSLLARAARVAQSPVNSLTRPAFWGRWWVRWVSEAAKLSSAAWRSDLQS